MFENLFSPSPLVWAALIGGLALLPPLIHLINLLRYRRIPWAAMEFLLKSHKRHRNWIRLKQWLLLAARVLTLLAFLFLLGNVGCEQNQIARLLGGSTTHHYILLDDSFSMSESTGNQSLFDRAQQVLTLIAARAHNRPNQFVTLLRFSRAQNSATALPTEDGTRNPSMATGAFDLNAVRVDTQFDLVLQKAIGQLRESQLALAPQSSLEIASQLISARPQENAIVYVLSDFRQKDWGAQQPWLAAIERLGELGAGIECVQCSDSERPNLAITDLAPMGNVRVAGTPLMMHVSIRNFGTVAARNVHVTVQTFTMVDNVESTAGLAIASPSSNPLPTLLIEAIEPGQTESRKFPVYFPVAGQHIIQAEAATDAVKIDNVRWNVTQFLPSAKVLLLATNKSFSSVQLALNPGGMTGIDTVLRGTDYLRDVSSAELSLFDVVFLMDVGGLDAAALEKLEKFCYGGGGVSFFLGPNVNPRLYNEQFYRDGRGIFPLLLTNAVELPPREDSKVSDVQPTDHPLMKPYTSGTTSLLDLVQVKKFVAADADWFALRLSAPNQTVPLEIAATVRGRTAWPLIVSSRFGEGRVVVVTTSANSEWNNWKNTPTFPALLLVIEDFVAAGKYPTTQRLAGQPLQITASSENYLPQYQFQLPSDDPQMPRVVTGAFPNSANSTDPTMRTELSLDSDGLLTTGWSGVGEYELRTRNGGRDLHRFEINVDTAESDLTLVERQALLAQCKIAKPKLVRWDEFNPNPESPAGSPFAMLLFAILLVLILMEQWLAYANSYHGSARVRAR
jgi:hypothetical protein